MLLEKKKKKERVLTSIKTSFQLSRIEKANVARRITRDIYYTFDALSVHKTTK